MFCRIYANGENADDELIHRSLAEITKGPVSDFGHIETNDYGISVTRNKEYNGKFACQFPDGFLYFGVSIELEFYNDGALDLMVDLTNKILQHLWNKGYSAIASCDYEDALLENGGYGSLNVPWPKQ